MDVRTAVKDKANYGEIVNWFRSQEPLNIEQLVLLIDTIEEMSEEIFEHHKALQELGRAHIKQIRKQYQREGGFASFLSESDKSRLAYVIRKACACKILLSEKYEDMVQDLDEKKKGRETVCKEKA